MCRFKMGIKTMVMLFFLQGIFSGCNMLKMDQTAHNVTFRNIGEYTSGPGKAKIMLVMYTGEADEDGIKKYAEELGCEMIFAFYYPDSVDMNEIPVQSLANAENFADAQELLFKGADAGRWRFASRCLGAIPTVTDCMKFPFSTNCR